MGNKSVNFFAGEFSIVQKLVLTASFKTKSILNSAFASKGQLTNCKSYEIINQSPFWSLALKLLNL